MPSEHSYYILLGYDTVQSGKLLPKFRRHILPHFYPEDGSSTFFLNISNPNKLHGTTLQTRSLHSHRCQNLKPNFNWEQLYTLYDYYVFGHYASSCFLKCFRHCILSPSSGKSLLSRALCIKLVPISELLDHRLEVRTSSIAWDQLTTSHLKTETECSLCNLVCFK
jgi:hypothetical protein